MSGKNDRPRPKMHVMLVTKQFDPEVLNILDQVVLLMLEHRQHFEYYFSDPVNIRRFQTLQTKIKPILFQAAQHEKVIDYIVTIGGDGTILFAASCFQNRPVPPIISFAKGTVGFLCNFELQDIKPTIARLVGYAITQSNLLSNALEYKMRLKCTLTNAKNESSDYHCFNEIAVQKAEISHQVRLEVYIGNKLLTGYSGDGLLVATPTGSTAYALSAGGPIVNNEIRSMLMVPISPNSLSFRPILMPASARIIIKLPKNARNSAKISVDGFVKWEMKEEDTLTIEMSPYDVLANISRKTTQEAIWADKLNLLLKWNYSPLSDPRPKL